MGLRPEDRQVRQRLAGGGRFQGNLVQLNLGVRRQRGEVGLGPTGSLEIADDDQFAPPAVGFRLGREHPPGHLQRGLHVHPLRQGAAAGQLLAEGLEIGRGALEDRPRRRPGQNQVGRQPRPVSQVAGRHGPGPLNLLDGPVGGGHALADVQDDHADRVAWKQIGHGRLLSPLRPRHGQGQQQHRQRPQRQQDQVAQPVPRAALLDRLADEPQRGQRHPHRPRPRQQVDHHRRRGGDRSDCQGPRVEKGHGERDLGI